MIKNKLINNQGYGFITVIFLVLALSCLSILAFVSQRDSDKLGKTVEDLAQTRSSIDRVDVAIQLLYAAENNCRMYIIQKDSTYAKAYKAQLMEVSGILDSISETIGEGPGSVDMEHLVADKTRRTSQYINARLLLDSLIQLAGSKEMASRSQITETRSFKAPAPKVSLDTMVERIAKPQAPKRKLFRRIGDAISNKQKDNESELLIIRQHQLDSVYQNNQRTIIRASAEALQEQASYFKSLKAKEQALLTANHNLLQGLQSILTSLKSSILQQQSERKMLLSHNAFSITKDIKFGNTLLIVFGLLLTLIIIWILQRLFANSKALKKAKEEAEEFARLKSEFAETMSHEIRTPLHSITSFANELSTDHQNGDQSEVIDAIKLSSGMLLSVVNNILDYTKMEKGRFKLAESPFNPMLVIKEILSGLRLQAKKKNILLEQYLDQAIDTVLIGDAFQLRQLLINLLSNAIKYTDKGSIRITACLNRKGADNCVLELAIKDTGIGIDGPVDYKSGSSVFDAYVTAIHRKEIKEGSTGLGLSIVKKVVELHKGKIDVESVVGKGTTFYIDLTYKASRTAKPKKHTPPRESAVDMPILPSETEIRISHKSIPAEKRIQQDQLASGSRVLVVDNDLLNRTYITMLLKRKGFNVTEADSAIVALEKYEHHVFDLIITDISMPEMSGYALAEAIRRHSGTGCSTPIIGVSGQKPRITGNGQPSVENFNGWLIKPFEPKELYELVNELIDGTK